MLEYYKADSQMWEDGATLQTVNIRVQVEKISSRSNNGDELLCSIATNNVKTTRSEVFTVTNGCGEYINIPMVGSIVNGWHIDSVKVLYSITDYPKVTIVGHLHLDTEHYLPIEHRAWKPHVMLPTGWGVLPWWCADNISSTGSYTILVEHIDGKDSDGLPSFAYDFYSREIIEADTFTDNVDNEISMNDGWASINYNNSEDAQDVVKFSQGYERTIPPVDDEEVTE